MADKLKPLPEVIAQMKQEVLADILNKTVPVDVATYGDLHDYVDANCYGGFCDDDGITDALIEQHGGREPKNEAMPDAVIDFMNAAQNAIGAWLASGEALASKELSADLKTLTACAPAPDSRKQSSATRDR